MDNKQVSKIQDHKLKKKEGLLVSPFNDAIGGNLKFNSWRDDRLPHYLWMGLIHQYYGRKVGMEKVGRILFGIKEINKTIFLPKLSEIFSLGLDDQELIYKLIVGVIEPEVLSPLTIIFNQESQQKFNDFFYQLNFPFDDRLKKITSAISIFSPHQSNEATDLRYLINFFLVITEKLSIHSDCSISIDVLENYPITSHDAEEMRMYRPAIRAMEINLPISEEDKEFSSRFWRNIGMITPCEETVIMHENSQKENFFYEDFITDSRNVLAELVSKNKEELLIGDKGEVLLGSFSYALKIFSELISNQLGTSVLSRLGIRTLIELLITIKYLVYEEGKHANIWYEYKGYGIGKLKLILLKAREYNFDNLTSHFSPALLEMIVNEEKWEEFIDVDFKFFDKKNIREKSEVVGEKEIYDLFYDYETNFSHGFWGAIRESSMLSCTASEHKAHSLPDIKGQQKLRNANEDCFRIICKIVDEMSKCLEIPVWYLTNYIRVEEK